MEAPRIYSTITYVIVLYLSAIVPRTSARSLESPALLQRAGKNVIFAADEFVSARLANPPTGCAYARPVANFLAWCEQQGIELRQVTPGRAGHLGDHLYLLGRLRPANTGQMAGSDFSVGPREVPVLLPFSLSFLPPPLHLVGDDLLQPPMLVIRFCPLSKIQLHCHRRN